jgi:hypothetical protein
VERFERKDFQDEHVKRALQKCGTCRWGLLHIDILFVLTFYMKSRGVSSVFFGWLDFAEFPLC